MRVEVHYCPVWNGYDRRAAGLAAEINSSTTADAEIVAGAKGQFDVLVDGELVFSKEREGRFPEHDEIFARLG